MSKYIICDVPIGKNIAKLRKASKLSQQKLSIELQLKGLNISRSRLSMIELDRLNLPLSMLLALKEIFKCNYEDLFKGLEVTPDLIEKD